MRSRVNAGAFSFYFLIVLYITLLSRSSTLARVVYIVPFRSFDQFDNWGQFALNAALFFPVGYFAGAMFPRARKLRGAVVTAFIISISIELVQYYTCRGALDVDDVISNTLGAWAGALIYLRIERLETAWIRRLMPLLLFAAGFVGCFIAANTTKDNTDAALTRQFDFMIESVERTDDVIIARGQCYLYGRETPGYRIYLSSNGKKVMANTVIEGDRFTATVGSPEEKAEVLVRFDGFPPVSTGCWIRPSGDTAAAEYVPGDIDGPAGVPEDAVLKAYSSEFDTFVFQSGQKMIWYIGCDLDDNTEIIYHLYTDEPEKLPENRIQYGFDNRGFRAGGSNEEPSIGRYRVFEDMIPDIYRVISISVGFNTGGEIPWRAYFRIDATSSVGQPLWD